MSELSPLDAEGVATTNRRFRGEIPAEHCGSADTKLRWLWNQRFGTVQSIWQNTTDGDTKAACALVLNAAYVGNLASISLLLQRLEGGAKTDEDLLIDPLPSMPI